MTFMTGEQYIESIHKPNMQVYTSGRKIDNPVDDPILWPSLNSVRMTYDLVQKPEYREFMTAVSPYIGQWVNRPTHIHRSTESLVRKVKIQRLLGQQTAACFQRCVDTDAFNAVFSTTYETGQEYGTHYHENFTKFVTYVQENDLTMDGAMTDPKDDRSKVPHEQAYPDLSLHIVERRPGGIVMRGAKMHQTGTLNSHEIIIVPTQSMKTKDRDYAVSFTMPMGTNGTFMIIGRQSCDTRRPEDSEMDMGNSEFGGVGALMVLDDVFVPNERISMCGEYDFAGMLVERFTGYHRQNCGGCKVSVDDVLTGVAAVAADYNGAARTNHIRDKFTEMTYLNETLYCYDITCSAEGYPAESGDCITDLLLVSVCRQNVTYFPYEIVRLVEDIAGGPVVTAPSEADLHNPRLGPVVNKYLRGVATVSTKNRLRTLRLIGSLVLSTVAMGYRIESVHGAGSPQAQCIMIARQDNLEHKKELAKVITHTKE